MNPQLMHRNPWNDNQVFSSQIPVAISLLGTSNPPHLGHTMGSLLSFVDSHFLSLELVFHPGSANRSRRIIRKTGMVFVLSGQERLGGLRRVHPGHSLKCRPPLRSRYSSRENECCRAPGTSASGPVEGATADRGSSMSDFCLKVRVW